jgi:hypothetical protein
MENLTCISWLNGKHSADIEINTRLPYVALYDFFAQGENAEEIINEINKTNKNQHKSINKQNIKQQPSII